MTLNLDPNFNPFPNSASIPYETFVFPGGEPHFKIASAIDTDEIFISHRITSFNDLGLLLMAIDAVRRSGAKTIRLFLPYFPAARQDRVMVAGEPFSLKVYARLINESGVDEVTVYDPHSDVTPALLDCCRVLDNHSFIEKVVADLPVAPVLISPDGGASKKIHQLAAHLKHYPVVECGKVRDVSTGRLSGFRVFSDDLNQGACLIVDDICDGGRTFLGLARELKLKNAGDLYLAVSHGIFSKGFRELGQVFKKIYCTDSFQHVDSNESVQQFAINYPIQ